jgi:hypothetical protein
MLGPAFLFGILILLRLVLCDEELRYCIAVALSRHVFLMFGGGGFQCADPEYQVVNLYDSSLSVYRLGPANLLRPLMKIRDFSDLGLGQVLSSL